MGEMVSSRSEIASSSSSRRNSCPMVLLCCGHSCASIRDLSVPGRPFLRSTDSAAFGNYASSASFCDNSPTASSTLLTGVDAARRIPPSVAPNLALLLAETQPVRRPVLPARSAVSRSCQVGGQMQLLKFHKSTPWTEESESDWAGL